MSLVSLRKSEIYFICSRIKYHRLQPARSHEAKSRRPSGGFRPHAGTEAPHTHMHTRHRRPACLLHEQKRARTSALHLHGRRACASPCCSSAGRLTPSHGPLDGRLAPTLAPTARRAVAAAPDSPPRERPHGCRRCRRCHRCRRAARLCAYHGRCRRPSTCENRTETPTATPPGSRGRPHGRTPAESTERGGARGGLAACQSRRLVALARRCRGGWSGTLLQAVKSTVLRTHGLFEAWK